METADAACRTEAREILRLADLTKPGAEIAVARAREIVDKLEADLRALRTGQAFQEGDALTNLASPHPRPAGCDPAMKAKEIVVVVGRPRTIDVQFDVGASVNSNPDVLQATKLDDERVALVGKRPGFACYAVGPRESRAVRYYDVRVISQDLGRVRDDLASAIARATDPDFEKYELLVLPPGCVESIRSGEPIIGVSVQHGEIVRVIRSGDLVRVEGLACGMSYVDVETSTGTTTWEVQVTDAVPAGSAQKCPKRCR